MTEEWIDLRSHTNGTHVVGPHKLALGTDKNLESQRRSQEVGIWVNNFLRSCLLASQVEIGHTNKV
jgi:hypothetical protein